jgi:Cupin-like domain
MIMLRDILNTTMRSTDGVKLLTLPKHYTMDIHPNDSSPSRKRCKVASIGSNNLKLKRNLYAGFSCQTPTLKEELRIRFLNPSEITPQSFWNEYISTRKPCAINGLPCDDFLKINKERLLQSAGLERVQVERRLNHQEAFGQTRSPLRQVEMTLEDFCETIDGPEGSLFYLSTQETENDDVFPVPCKQLLEQKIIPNSIPWASNLSLQSCNLWMGKNSNVGTSSGLHHDFHDNIYILLYGTKVFRLYSPDSAFHLQTYGEIDCIHHNGLISYTKNKTYSDGRPIEQSDSESDDDEEEDEALPEEFKNGFNVKSEGGSDDFSDFDSDEVHSDHDDYDQLVGASLNMNTSDCKPDHFSKIELKGRALDELSLEYPLISSLKEMVIELKAGQSLYLPAGWFHEVTSISADHGYHLAVNYWFYPPNNLGQYDKPYSINK